MYKKWLYPNPPETKNPAVKLGLVRIKGLEPPRLSALDPKSSAATNYAISANPVQRYNLFPNPQTFIIKFFVLINFSPFLFGKEMDLLFFEIICLTSFGMVLRFLLAPMALLYGIAVYTRNWLFDVGILKSQSFSTPSVCVGNLTVGGTGKTPHIEYLVKLLQNNYSVATLSRGYKRQTKGFLLANHASNAHDIGDEPMQIKLKFPGITVAVDENRVRGINNLLQINSNIDIILLDDAYQHRYVKAGLNILLTDYGNPIYNDYLLPMGRLRDSIVQKRRTNIVIVTKCPENLEQATQNEIAKKLNLSRNQELYFTTFRYGKPMPLFNGINPDLVSKPYGQIVALAGIANPKPFFKYLEKEHAVCEIMHYPDHYHFTETKIKAIFEKFSMHPNKPVAIVTTEKDAARIRVFNDLPIEMRRVFFYIPIEVDFLNTQGNDFNNKLHEYVRKSKRNNGIHSEQGNR